MLISRLMGSGGAEGEVDLPREAIVQTEGTIEGFLDIVHRQDHRSLATVTTCHRYRDRNTVSGLIGDDTLARPARRACNLNDGATAWHLAKHRTGDWLSIAQLACPPDAAATGGQDQERGDQSGERL